MPDNANYKNHTKHDIRVIIVSALYDKGVAALGYVTESVGLDKRTLIEEMGKYGVPVLKLTEKDVKDMIKNAKIRARAR